jgi:hypothetical protein
VVGLDKQFRQDQLLDGTVRVRYTSMDEQDCFGNSERLAMTRYLQAALFILLAASATLAQPLPDRMTALVPLYIFPDVTTTTNGWSRVITATNSINIVAIANPNNGPGSAVQAPYTTAINQLNTAGGATIGYVYTRTAPTSTTLRPIEDVKADIQRWYSFYGDIKGIFIDEVTHNAANQNLAYYSELHQYTRSIQPNALVIGNPGAADNVTQQLLTANGTQAANALVVVENTHSGYQSQNPASWTLTAPRSQIAHIIHTSPDATTMLADVTRAASLNAGYVYVTDQNALTGTNTFGFLPSYWDSPFAQSEVAAIRNTPVPEPASVLGLAALIGISFAVVRFGYFAVK